MDFRDGPSIKKALAALLMIEWSINNDHMLNKNARNGKKWKSIILQRAHRL